MKQGEKSLTGCAAITDRFFVKRPFKIRAFQWTSAFVCDLRAFGADLRPLFQLRDFPNSAPLWIREAIRNIRITEPRPSVWRIRTLEGELSFAINDWIIEGVRGEIYACKDEIFKETYEEAQND